jgi:hypothetical protein
MKSRTIWPILICALLIVSSVQCAAATRFFSPGTQEQNREDNQPQPAPENDAEPLDQGDFEGDPFGGDLEGMWTADTDTGYGTTMHTELVLEYTGTFSQQVTAGSLMTLDTGTYEVGDGFIRFTCTHHEPTEYKGRPMQWQTGWTYYYSFIDEDTVQFEDKIAGATWLMYRE